jgi:hypothetical protein
VRKIDDEMSKKANFGDGGKSASISKFRPRSISGWTVNVHEKLLEDDSKAATSKALELLEKQLNEIVRVVPEAAVTELRKVPLWFSPEYPGVQPKAEYHPDAGWLKDNGRDPAMAKSVEFTNVRIFEREMARMPNFALHELAHAYHDRVLQDGFSNGEITAAFENSKSNGIYEKVERRFGDGRMMIERAYAMTNPMEYFAEATEAYFTTNDFYPFTRAELEKHDLKVVGVLRKLWKIDEGS